MLSAHRDSLTSNDAYCSPPHRQMNGTANVSSRKNVRFTRSPQIFGPPAPEASALQHSATSCPRPRFRPTECPTRNVFVF
jgi:hypothetical protein